MEWFRVTKAEGHLAKNLHHWRAVMALEARRSATMRTAVAKWNIDRGSMAWQQTREYAAGHKANVWRLNLGLAVWQHKTRKNHLAHMRLFLRPDMRAALAA